MASSHQRDAWASRMKSFQTKQTDINKLILNRLVAEGYRDVAQKFEFIAKLESGEELDTLEYKLRIRRAVRAGQIKYAMDLAKKLYPKLYETDNYNYFHLQQLRLIELIRERKLQEADNLARSQSEQETTLVAIDWSKDPLSIQELMLKSAFIKYEQCPKLDPKKMMFLVKLILWAQHKLENEGCVNYSKYNIQINEDFEEELSLALQTE